MLEKREREVSMWKNATSAPPQAEKMGGKGGDLTQKRCSMRRVLKCCSKDTIAGRGGATRPP
jgi:hypothetical protein